MNFGPQTASNWTAKNWGLKTFTFVQILDDILNEAWYRQLDKGVKKYEWSPTLSQDFTNFGPQTS